MISLVIDTNVFVAALKSGGGAARQMVRLCLSRHYEPLFSAALFAEYEELLDGPAMRTSALSVVERREVLAALAATGRWVHVYFAWRPNLPDEDDNYLIELAIAGGAAAVVTYDTRDLRRGELKFTGLRILTPAECLREFPCPP
ncbi:putative toxin-antitoxin system toxin component, PIN family [Vineibacter terrae]|uniref:putative toxin-antitoxin system toxin component, PIN family n=1 Tax=Vineibacter terrae TaxID=2586908 RepID=UPI0039C91BC5